MLPEPAEQRLYTLWGEIRDLQSAQDLLEWDQETYMPLRGQEARGQALATLAGIKHQRLVAPELLEALAECAAQATPGSLLADQVRCARVDVDRAVLLPEALVRALAKAKSAGLAAWHAARQKADFAGFAQPLAELIRLRREEAAAVCPDGLAYDALLDIYEPGITEAELVPLFAELRQALTRLVRGIAESGRTVDESSALGHFPATAQLAFGRQAAAAIGFDFAAGRLDPSGHPFCVALARDDVRLTWRWHEDDFRPGLFGILHESGHALYEQGVPAAWQRTPAGSPLSLGTHESQSRLWENQVGRSHGFWRWALPRFQAAFDRADLTLEALWPALHTVKPSLIRVDADEATYNLHVVIRFELERALFAGNLEVNELPAAWDALYRELLGVQAKDARDGVLQDIHWAQGMFGYFPTYTLGTILAAQLFAAAERVLGPQDEAFAAGEFHPLLTWLRQNVHAHGGRYSVNELARSATGEKLSSQALLRYLTHSTALAYGLPVAP